MTLDNIYNLLLIWFSAWLSFKVYGNIHATIVRLRNIYRG